MTEALHETLRVPLSTGRRSQQHLRLAYDTAWAASATPTASSEYVDAGAFAIQGKYWIAGPNVRRPIPAQLDVSPGPYFTLANPDTGIFGSGETVVLAVEDLRSALVDHLRVLADQGDALSEELRQQRDYLIDHLSHI